MTNFLSPFGQYASALETDLMDVLRAGWVRIIVRHDMTVGDYNNAVSRAASYRARGAKVALTMRWDDFGGMPPTTSDYADARAWWSQCKTDFQPSLGVHENEMLSPSFFSGTVAEYLAQHTAFCDEMHKSPLVKATDGGIHSRLLTGSRYWEYEDSGDSAGAAAYLALVSHSAAETTAMTGAGMHAQENGLTTPFLAGLAATGADYVNSHYYREAAALSLTIPYLTSKSGLPAVCNEWGQFAQDRQRILDMLAVLDALDVAIYFNFDFFEDPYVTGDFSEMLNVSGTATLTTNGEAFRDYIAASDRRILGMQAA